MKETESNISVPIIKVAFLDVGQGDSIVISCPSTHEAIVVDCVDANSVINYLMKEKVIYLRGVVITHLHTDHYAGVATLLANYHKIPNMKDCEVLAFNEIFNQKNLQNLELDSDGHSSSVEGSPGPANRARAIALSNLIRWRKQNKLKYLILQVQKGLLPFDGTLAKSLHLLHPYAADYRSLETKGLNNTSVVLHVTGPGSSALLTGDLEPNGWAQLEVNHPDLHSDVFKFPHHGSWKDADAEALLDTIKPSIVIMSVGTEGYDKYNHPNPHVFNALAERPHIRVLCTQATNQCQASVQEKRASVIKLYETQSSDSGYQIPTSKRGCPCAGTIIIELGDEARITQPDLKFHREIIIEPHFTEHKCKFAQVSLQSLAKKGKNDESG